MKKMSFLLGSIKPTTINSLLNVRNKVKEKSNKHFILLDMIYCSLRYQAAFYDYLEFEFYSINNKQRKTYLTNGKNNEIVKTFNDKNYWYLLDDKAEFNKLYKKYLNRDFLLPNSSIEEFNSFIKNKDRVIVKPVDGVGGVGIKIVSTKEENLYEKYKKYLIEEIIIQNDKLNEIYNKSVNSLRLFTFYDGKNSYLLQSIIKFGNGNVVDNFSSGGMYAFVSDDGTIITPAIDKNDNIYVKDSLDDSEYVLDEGMDMLHSLAFMNKILSYPLKSNSIKEGQEEWGDEIYIQVDTELFLENEHFDTARIFINKKTKTPIGIIVYDKEGNDSLRIIYYDFKKVKGFDESIFN